MRTALVLTAIALLMSGCATYIPPGAKADLQAFARPDIQAGFGAKPTNPFPASIAVVRVQAPAYTNHYLQQRGGTYGSGRYTVILAKEADEDSQLERVSKLQQVAGLVTINRMLLPERLDGDKEIRGAASRLQADLLFLYTFDTAFFDTDMAKPLSVVTLGLSPTRKDLCSYHVLCAPDGYAHGLHLLGIRSDRKSANFRHLLGKPRCRG